MSLTEPNWDILIQKAVKFVDRLEEKARIESELSEIELKDIEADSYSHRVYSYFYPMESEPVREAVETLGLWARRDEELPKKEREITILLNSPGGLSEEGFAFHDWILAIQKEMNFEVQIVGLGQVSSMASVVIQAAKHRVMYKNAWMLIHEYNSYPGDGYFDGKLSVQEEELKFVRRLEAQGNKILAKRSSLTAAEIEEKIKKHDWWLSAKEALALGFIDEVR